MIRIEHLSADLLGLDALSRRALSGALQPFGVATRREHITHPEDPYLPAEREQIARALEAAAARHGPHVRVLESIRSLAKPGATCVVASATPFVLGGPLNQLFGALQAIVLANQLTSQERPVVPVLWVRSDEHRTRPLITARVVNRHHTVQSLHLDPVAKTATPIRSVPLEEKLHGLGSMREVLRQLYGDYAHIDEALATFVPVDGESLSDAMVRGMYQVFGELGLVIVEPKTLREDLARACATCVGEPLAALLATAKTEHAIEDPAVDGAPWLSLLTPGDCRDLFHQDGEFAFEGEPGSRTGVELAAELVQAPRDWQVGPLLESPARAAVLPVIAEVGGPLELQRHLLWHRVGDERGWPRPAFVPRIQATLVDDLCVESLGRLELTVEEVLRQRGEIESHGIAPQAEELLETIDQIAEQARRALREQKRALLDIGPTLKPALRAASSELTAALKGLSKKVSYVAANRGGKLDRHRRRLSNVLCPSGGPQADLLCPVPWLAREGASWLQELARDIDPFSSEHLAVFLE